ncbi:MAG: hypothetical protein ABJC74_14990, partial [Gemmatimonadota bacterium]
MAGFLIAGLVLHGCKPGDVIESPLLPPPVEPAQGPPVVIRVISGDSQFAPIDHLLAQPLVVRVFDSIGNPYPNVIMGWTVNKNGALHADLVTDSVGTARATWRLGDTAGTQLAVVSSPGLPSVTMVATGTVSLAKLTISPLQTTLGPGGTQGFSVSGIQTDGSPVVPLVTYTTTGGTITASGLYTAPLVAGSYLVVVTDRSGRLADTAAASVVLPTITLQSIKITPTGGSLVAGTTRQFAAAGLMTDGSTIVPDVTWTATGGTVSSSGLFTAGAIAGPFTVTATQLGGSIKASVSGTVTSVGTITPWVNEDFSAYTSSAQMLADPQGLYSKEDGYNTDARITLDQTQGVNGSTKSMKYTFGPTTKPCAETTIGRNFKFPSTVREAWVEIWAKFSQNWTTSARAGCSSNPDYKFVFGRVTGQDGARFDILIGNTGNAISVSWPGHEESGHFPMAPKYQVFDGAWHRYRFHYKLATSGQQDGGTELWIDGNLAFSNLNSTT